MGPINSWNPIWANLQHFHHMLFVQRKWHGWQTPFVHWTPPNSRCPRLGSRLNPLAKFDAFPGPGALRVYVVFEALLIIAAGSFIDFANPSAQWISQSTGWGSRESKSVLYGVIFIALALALTSVGTL